VVLGGNAALGKVADVAIRDFKHLPQLLDYL